MAQPSESIILPTQNFGDGIDSADEGMEVDDDVIAAVDSLVADDLEEGEIDDPADEEVALPVSQQYRPKV